ncbi:MAG TPA: ATP-binding protein [Rhabdochlamydiaceae bacterium]|nr:ATP-binding protein [Rhabdochlamydiaceae bacterium]
MEINLQQLLERLQGCDECQRIETKESKSTLGMSVIETISAFSNEPDMGGGYLILGLKKNKDYTSNNRYSITGVDDPDKIQCDLASVCRSAFNIQIRPKISVESVDGKVLVVAFIAESFCRDKPVFIKKYGEEKGAYRRIGSSDQRCTAEDLDLLYQLRRQRVYESDVFPETSWEDVASDAITEYRRLRIQIDPSASELVLDDRQLLISLGHAVRKGKEIIPTIGGLLLFGTKAALRRTMPMAARIDYILVEGIEWVQNPLERYHSIEYREALVTVITRLHAQIMSDLPTRFQLKTGDLQRSDVPSIPRDVIREALANALMHRDYRVGQAIQIIRYSNRIEFHNPGYSLKPFDEMCQSGSLTRNEKIAAVFHDLKFAETKGTGITTMKRLMNEAGLSTPPLIETDRDRNKFNLLLLPHHLLDEGDLRWLSQFHELKLSESDMRALVLAREVGAITNQDYRQINGTHTLAASNALRHLRDLGLLTMKGSGSETYYQPVPQIIGNNDTAGIVIKGVGTPYISSLSEELPTCVNPLHKGLNAIPKGFPDLPQDLKNRIIHLKKRSAKEEVEDIIIELCSFGPLQPVQIGKILDRDAQYLRIHFLSVMIKKGKLVYQHPNKPAHPQQAYKSVSTNSKVPEKDQCL